MLGRWDFGFLHEGEISLSYSRYLTSLGHVGRQVHATYAHRPVYTCCVATNEERSKEGRRSRSRSYVKDDEDEQRCGGGGGNRRTDGRTRTEGSATAQRALLGCFSPTWNLAAVGGHCLSVRRRTCRKFQQKSITSRERTLRRLET